MSCDRHIAVASSLAAWTEGSMNGIYLPLSFLSIFGKTMPSR